MKTILCVVVALLVWSWDLLLLFADDVFIVTPQSVSMADDSFMSSTGSSVVWCNSSANEDDNTSTAIITATDCQTPGSSNGQTDQSQQGGQDSGKTSSRRSRGYNNGQVSKESYTSIMKIVDPVRFSLHLLAIPILTLTVISFAREKNITCSNSFVLGLNLFEALAAFLNAVFYSMKYSLEPTAKIYVIWVLVCNYGIVCSRRVVYIFNFLLCVQRLLAIVSPIKSRHTFTKTWRNWTFGAVICSTFGAHVYLTLMYEVKDLGNGMHVMARSTYYQEWELLFNSLGYVAKSLFSYIPLILSLIINIVLIFVLKRHNMRAKKIRTTKDEEFKNKQERQMTLMILVSTIAFTVMSLPANLNQMISTIIGDYGTGKKDHYLYSAIKGGANAVQTIGDLTNFASYLLLSSTFRRQVLLTITFSSSSKKKPGFSGVTSNTALQTSVQQEKTVSSVTNEDRAGT